ncbi:polysaccharide deacetylase family protein [Paenibacillus sp. PR3]|uniref:Polysaccharide deacetylase family protein n=1 Tax=Paenibacillus terricola TaxID=2763503 RepID=A0ABR8MRB1_9BACL|nr:polysaccharide deacetylase family protein [Paenibacillus terricola]MBD3918530.1 polysaccharide deacetylase family protein [Paenibacillus terricola]
MKLVDHAATKRNVIAFTFDDGPDPIYTPQILSLFREVGGRATFYMIGSQVEANPDIARMVLSEGHELGNHTYTHPNLTELDSSAIISELTRTDQIIKHETGAVVRTFRPPYLAHDEKVDETIAEHFGYPSIGAMNLNSNDWSDPGVEHIVAESQDYICPGNILIFHDGGSDRSQTVEAVRQLIHMAADRGYQMITVSELLQLAACEA